MKNTTPIPPGTKQELIAYVQAGHNVMETTKHFSISTATIYKILRAAGVAYKTKRKLHLEEVETYVKEHPYLMLKEYAAVFGVSISGIHQFLNKHCIDYKNTWHSL